MPSQTGGAGSLVSASGSPFDVKSMDDVSVTHPKRGREPAVAATQVDHQPALNTAFRENLLCVVSTYARRQRETYDQRYDATSFHRSILPIVSAQRVLNICASEFGFVSDFVLRISYSGHTCDGTYPYSLGVSTNPPSRKYPQRSPCFTYSRPLATTCRTGMPSSKYQWSRSPGKDSC